LENVNCLPAGRQNEKYRLFVLRILHFSIQTLHFALRHYMRCVIAGGGTGGHLFPGMAVAEAFVEREIGNGVLFIGTERGIEARVLAGGKFPLRMIEARPIKGRS
jgi:hypothetical protein